MSDTLTDEQRATLERMADVEARRAAYETCNLIEIVECYGWALDRGRPVLDAWAAGKRAGHHARQALAIRAVLEGDRLAAVSVCRGEGGRMAAAVRAAQPADARVPRYARRAVLRRSRPFQVVPEMSATQPTNPPGSPAFDAEIDELVRILKTPQFRSPHNAPTVTWSSEAAATMIERLRLEQRNLVGMLAECYRLTGADPDGNEDWRLAPHAVAEVRRMRAEHDAEATPDETKQYIALLENKVRRHAAAAEIFQPGGALHGALKLGADAVVDGLAWLVEQHAVQASYRAMFRATIADLHAELAQFKTTSGQPASETRRSGFTPCADCQHHDFCRSWCDGVGRCAQTRAGVPRGTVNADSAKKAGNA